MYLDVFKLIYIIFEIGFKVTLLSSGKAYDPYYQDRYYNELTNQGYINNYEYSTTEWVSTFITEGESNAKR